MDSSDTILVICRISLPSASVLLPFNPSTRIPLLSIRCQTPSAQQFNFFSSALAHLSRAFQVVWEDAVYVIRLAYHLWCISNSMEQLVKNFNVVAILHLWLGANTCISKELWMLVETLVNKHYMWPMLESIHWCFSCGIWFSYFTQSLRPKCALYTYLNGLFLQQQSKFQISNFFKKKKKRYWIFACHFVLNYWLTNNTFSIS